MGVLLGSSGSELGVADRHSIIYNDLRAETGLAPWMAEAERHGVGSASRFR